MKVSPLELPPPGEGLSTATLTPAGEAISLLEIEAVRRVLLLKVVGRLSPFQVTVDSAMKFEPLTARVKGEPPALAELGLSLVIVGTGLLIRNAKALVAVAGVG